MAKQVTIHIDLQAPTLQVCQIDVQQQDDHIEIALRLENTPLDLSDLPLPRFTVEEVAEIERRFSPPPRPQGFGWPALLGALLLGWWLGS